MEGREFGGPSPEETGMDSSLKKEGGQDMGQQEKVKSPEELRFDALVEDARHRSLKGDYAFAETEEDAEAIDKESMFGAYLESGDPEKMAMYRLQELRLGLDVLKAYLASLARLDKEQEDPRYSDRAKISIKKMEEFRDREIAKLEATLSELGLELAIPQTVEEVKALEDSVISFENLQKIAKKYDKVQQEMSK